MLQTSCSFKNESTAGKTIERQIGAEHASIQIAACRDCSRPCSRTVVSAPSKALLADDAARLGFSRESLSVRGLTAVQFAPCSAKVDNALQRSARPEAGRQTIG